MSRMGPKSRATAGASPPSLSGPQGRCCLTDEALHISQVAAMLEEEAVHVERHGRAVAGVGFVEIGAQDVERALHLLHARVPAQPAGARGCAQGVQRLGRSAAQRGGASRAGIPQGPSALLPSTTTAASLATPGLASTHVKPGSMVYGPLGPCAVRRHMGTCHTPSQRSPGSQVWLCVPKSLLTLQQQGGRWVSDCWAPGQRGQRQLTQTRPPPTATAPHLLH